MLWSSKISVTQMQCNRNPIEFEFCWGVAAGEMGIRIPKPVCRKRCSVMSTKVESGRRETRGLCPVFPATKQRGSSRTTKQPARNGQAGDNYGHWPRDGQVWQLWPGTSKYGNYDQERASMATMARQQARMRMSMLVKCVWETPLGKGLTTRVN